MLALLVLLAQTASPVPTVSPGWPTPIFKYGGDTEGGAPYSYQDPDDPSKLIGLDVDVAEEIARRAGAKPLFFQNQWVALIPALNRGDCDVVVNGMEVTPDRAPVVDFSRPYFIFQEELTVRAGETAITGMDSLPGHRVGTLSGSLARQMLEDVKGVTIVSYDDVVEPYKDLGIKRVDAVLMDAPIASFYAHPDAALQRAGPLIGMSLYAAVVRKGDSQRLAAIDAAIGAMIGDGTLEKILRKWHLWSDVQQRLVQGRALTDAYEKHTALQITKAENTAEPLLPAFAAPVSTPGASPTPDEAELAVHKPKSFAPYIPWLLKGAAMTLFLSICSFALAVLVGLPLALTRIYAPPPLRFLAICYIEAMRGTPLLLQLYVLYYGAPEIGIRLSALAAAILGLGLNYAAYEAEVYRAAITSIPGGQTEAAFSLGMSRVQSLRWVILPQAIRIAMPPSTNDFIALFKDSSLVSVITVVELTKQFSIFAASTYSYGELGAMTAILYLMMSVPLAWLARQMERRLSAGAGAQV